MRLKTPVPTPIVVRMMRHALILLALFAPVPLLAQVSACPTTHDTRVEVFASIDQAAAFAHAYRTATDPAATVIAPFEREDTSTAFALIYTRILHPCDPSQPVAPSGQPGWVVRSFGSVADAAAAYYALPAGADAVLATSHLSRYADRVGAEDARAIAPSTSYMPRAAYVAWQSAERRRGVVR